MPRQIWCRHSRVMIVKPIWRVQRRRQLCVLHLARPLLTRDAYQALWDSWRREEGFEVLSCISSNAFVSLQGDVAVFVHDVTTELRMQGEQFFSQERETIVFKRQGSRTQEQQGLWLACHEHLSAMPEGLPPP